MLWLLPVLLAKAYRCSFTFHISEVIAHTDALSKVAAIWIICIALVRARMLEPKVISTRLVAQLSAAFGVTVWLADIVFITVFLSLLKALSSLRSIHQLEIDTFRTSSFPLGNLFHPLNRSLICPDRFITMILPAIQPASSFGLRHDLI